MLQALVTRASGPAGLVRRGRVILLSAAGEAGVDIAARLDLSPEAVSRIRRQFVQEGVDGLVDRPKAGRRDHAADFLRFMNTVVRAYPGCALHVILDNSSTHCIPRRCATG